MKQSAERCKRQICEGAEDDGENGVSVRIWQRVRDGSRSGRAAAGPERAAEASARALHRAVQRHAFYRSARRESPHMDVPHPPVGDAPALRRDPLGLVRSGPFNETPTTPNQLRWDPLPMPEKETDFLDGMVTLGGNGDPAMQAGVAIHLYARKRLDAGPFLCQCRWRDADRAADGRAALPHRARDSGDAPGEICVIPRGVKFRVELRGETGSRLHLRELRTAVPAA